MVVIEISTSAVEKLRETYDNLEQALSEFADAISDFQEVERDSISQDTHEALLMHFPGGLPRAQSIMADKEPDQSDLNHLEHLISRLEEADNEE